MQNGKLEAAQVLHPGDQKLEVSLFLSLVTLSYVFFAEKILELQVSADFFDSQTVIWRKFQNSLRD